MTTLHQAINQMASAGLPIPPRGHPIIDGKIHRYDFQKRGDKRAWYVMHEWCSPAGRQYIHGSFGIWGLLESQLIEATTEGLSLEQVNAFREQHRLAREQQAQFEKQKHERAMASALVTWRGASKTGHSPYLERKSLDEFNTHPDGFKFDGKGGIVAPMLRFDREREDALVGLQTIASDGTKLFTKGAEKSGSAFRLGEIVKKDFIIFCEGLATGLSIRLALNRELPVVVCWDAGNLSPVAEIFRGLYPTQPFLFAADDDWKTTVKDPYRGQVPYNTGVVMAYEAAYAVEKSIYTKPSFRDLPPGAKRQNKWTDFNDLHQQLGIDAVREQIESAINSWSIA